MKIISITLNNVKKFINEQLFDFNNADIINTVSGGNGSGKSTVFETALLCQKAYFVQKLSELSDSKKYYGIDVMNLVKETNEEIKTIIVNSAAYIKMHLRFSENDFDDKNKMSIYTATDEINLEKVFDVRVNLYVSFLDGIINWRVEVDEGENTGLLNEFWNLHNPSQIILYLEADKNVYEEDFTYEKISMITEIKVNPIVQFVLQSKTIYQNMYNIVMNSYIYQRVNPQKPKKDLFISESKEMYNKLISSIEIKNFSGKEKQNQFILMANNHKKYDARNMSSGEKLIWYTLLIINYIKKIGVLVIDEPENHLHEQLAWKFTVYLKNEIVSKLKTVNQIFMITHSKNMIYNNFSLGVNYVINMEGELLFIDKENCEDILRECGVSYVDDYILFVEGNTESDLLPKYCERNNIRLKKMSNCAEIIQTYNSLVKVKELLYAPKFVFMIDADTRREEYIEKMREEDPDFFDKHFAVLPVHEFENFALDESLLCKVINEINNVFNQEKMEEREIYNIMKNAANDSLEGTKKKFLNVVIWEELKTIPSIIKKNDIVIDNKKKYEEYIDNVLGGDDFNRIKKKIKNKYEQMTECYSVLKWSSDWKKNCDGKQVFNITISNLSRKIGVKPDVLKRKIFDTLMENDEGLLFDFWNDKIIKKLFV